MEEERGGHQMLQPLPGASRSPQSPPPPDWSQIPPEIWCLVFDNNIKKPKDLSNALLASPQLWDQILHSRKVDFLFPSILPIISKRDQYIDHTDLLNCRLVSTSWKKHVDNFLKSHPCFVNLDGVNHEKKDCCTPTHSDSSYCWQRATICVQTSVQIHSILQHLDIYPNSNPFVTHYLEFRDFGWDPAISDEISPELWNDLKTLLGRVGSTILHFQFLSGAQRTGPVFYRYICELLQLLPNLRTLRFWLMACPGDIMVPQCEELIQSSPLPDMKYLHVLKSVHLPTVIMNALLRKYSNQLKKLEILSFCRHNHLYSYDKDSINCSSELNEISVRLWGLNDVWKLNSSGLLSSSVTSLNVFIDLTNDNDILEKLFYVLSTSNSSASLEKFSLEILVDTYGPRKKMVDPQTRLKLPAVKKLQITSRLRCLNTIDFILEVDLLEELVVIMKDIRIMDHGCSKGYGGYSPELLKFIGYEECLYQSNIWELLPKLNTIFITDEVLEEEDNGYSFFDRDTSTHKRYFQYNRARWEEVRIKAEN